MNKQEAEPLDVIGALDEIARITDRLDAAIATLHMPGIPDSIHANALRDLLPEYRDALRAQYVRATGENPWE